MKRKLLCICLLALFCVSFLIPASADALWEPYDVLYYRTGLPRIDQIYVVPDGMTVNVYDSPIAKGVIKTLVSGDRIYIGPYDTVRGDTWGVGYVLGDWDAEGWVRLGRLQKEYSNQEFQEDFGDQFVSTDDQLTQTDIETEIITWTYPGSGIVDATLPKEVLEGSYNGGVMDFRYVYTDSDGGRWGYVGYFMGRCGWVYLNDPETLDAPSFPQTPENTVTDTSPEEASGTSPLIWIGLLILAACTATAVIILRLKRRARS